MLSRNAARGSPAPVAATRTEAPARLLPLGLRLADEGLAAAGSGHSVALKNDDTLVGWGDWSRHAFPLAELAELDPYSAKRARRMGDGLALKRDGTIDALKGI